MQKQFRRFAEKTSLAVGTPWAFMTAIGIVAVWGATGPLFGFSQQWQLLINSFTTIATFLMVFIIQNTQNRDFRILQLKLTELPRVSEIRCCSMWSDSPITSSLASSEPSRTWHQCQPSLTF